MQQQQSHLTEGVEALHSECLGKITWETSKTSRTISRTYRTPTSPGLAPTNNAGLEEFTDVSHYQSLQDGPHAAETLDKVKSTPKTMQSLSSQSSLHSYSSLSSSFINDGRESPSHGLDQSKNSTICLQKRPRISNLQQHHSTSKIASEDHPLQPNPQHRKKPTKGRCVSAGPATRACFQSPDRFLPQRPATLVQTTSYRVSKPPSTLHDRERYTRRKDISLNPFRSTSEDRSRAVVRRRAFPGVFTSSPPYHIPSFVRLPDEVPPHFNNNLPFQHPRQISVGGVWNVGGRAILQAGQIHAVPDGNGGLLASGSNAPMHFTHFLDHDTPDDRMKAQERRLAFALDIDQASRILPNTPPQSPTSSNVSSPSSPLRWQNSTWRGPNAAISNPGVSQTSTPATKAVPSLPFRVLDAPNMKDDYYCSILAFSRVRRTLAVALTNRVYLWTENSGVHFPPFPPARATHFVTSLSFSSDEGGKAILAIARYSGRVSLWSLFESEVRFDIPHPHPATCLSFKPSISHRQSATSPERVPCEDLLVGDDVGHLYFYSVEWPDQASFDTGSMTLLAKILAHSQNICGLAWCPDGEHFATGGNDNSALIFEIDTVLDASRGGYMRGRTRQRQPQHRHRSPHKDSPFRSSRVPESTQDDILHDQHPLSPLPDRPPRMLGGDLAAESSGVSSLRSINVGLYHNVSPGVQLPITPPTSPPRIRLAPLFTSETPVHENLHRHSFYHSAAVKALAFAPWQPTLLATGGGSNDRQLHFHHTSSGATLAIINVFAQVTSLVWSRTKREIAATFGYAQPEHEIRIAVFAWPSCECVVAIPWEKKQSGEFPRALWAIGYPGGPNEGLGRDSNGRRRRVRGVTRSEDERIRPWNREFRFNGNDNDGGGAEEERVARRRGEGETWASRTEDEGSLIIACCDETVKFFEVWAGRSKGNRKGAGLGTVGGVLGGSSILEGELGVDLDGREGEVIR